MPLRLRLPLLLLLVAGVFAACDAPCDTATCLADRAVADWTADPAGVTARVTAIPDEITRTVVVSRLAETYPGATRDLCAALPAGTSRARCDRINSRPHLSIVPGAVTAGSRSAPGDVPRESPEAAAAAPAKPPTPSFPDVRLPLPPPKKPDSDPCAAAPDRSACLDRAAVEAATAGDAGGADAVCARHTEPRWADECRFSAAEQAVQARRGEAYPAAAALCGAATRFTHECWSHVLTRLPKNVSAPGGGAGRAKSAIALAEDIARAWATTSPEAGAAHVSRFWALYFANVYREASEPVGTPLQFYPEEAWPHVRAALTVRLHALGRLQGTLEQQLAAVRAALARRGVSGSARIQGADLVFVSELGVPASDGPTVYFLGAPRRALGVDEEQDLVFCLIESAARTEPPDEELLREVAAGDDPRAAVEAERLLAALAARPD